MPDVDRSLRETLSSGASRILNAAEISRRLELDAGKAGAPTPELLFRHRGLNRAVFIKRPKDGAPTPLMGLANQTTTEIIENGVVKTVSFESQARVEKGDIATIFYLPFDADNIRDGGHTFDLSGRGKVQALLDIAGFDVRGGGDSVARDLRLLDTVSDLPSLDPFLLRDRIEAEGISAPDAYFNITEAEFQEIKKYILAKFSPITERVVDPSARNAQEITDQFILKLWEAKDLEYLAPITEVFRIEPDEASEIYYSWKGVTYYEFQYKRSQKDLLGFAEWLHTKAEPSHFVKAQVREEIAAASREVARAFAAHLRNSSEILKIYNDAYTELFVRGGEARPFIDFLRESSTLFWDIATSISAMHHGTSVWRQHIRRSKDGLFTADELKTLLDTLDRVIV